MEGTPAATPTEEPRREVVEEVVVEAPVTRDDLRALRRWILVAGVWAVAATAVALIALLDTSGDDAERTATGAANSAAEAREAQDGIRERLDELEARLGDVPQAEDVSSLQTRLSRIEGESKKASTDAGNAQDKLTDLEDRVKAIEDEPADAGGADAGSPTDTP